MFHNPTTNNSLRPRPSPSNRLRSPRTVIQLSTTQTRDRRKHRSRPQARRRKSIERAILTGGLWNRTATQWEAQSYGYAMLFYFSEMFTFSGRGPRRSASPRETRRRGHERDFGFPKDGDAESRQLGDERPCDGASEGVALPAAMLH